MVQRPLTGIIAGPRCRVATAAGKADLPPAHLFHEDRALPPRAADVGRAAGEGHWQLRGALKQLQNEYSTTTIRGIRNEIGGRFGFGPLLSEQLGSVCITLGCRSCPSAAVQPNGAGFQVMRRRAAPRAAWWSDWPRASIQPGRARLVRSAATRRMRASFAAASRHPTPPSNAMCCGR